jgi:hypothetical protein
MENSGYLSSRCVYAHTAIRWYVNEILKACMALLRKDTINFYRILEKCTYNNRVVLKQEKKYQHNFMEVILD